MKIHDHFVCDNYKEIVLKETFFGFSIIRRYRQYKDGRIFRVKGYEDDKDGEDFEHLGISGICNIGPYFSLVQS